MHLERQKGSEGGEENEERAKTKLSEDQGGKHGTKKARARRSETRGVSSWSPGRRDDRDFDRCHRNGKGAGGTHRKEKDNKGGRRRVIPRRAVESST